MSTSSFTDSAPPDLPIPDSDQDPPTFPLYDDVTLLNRSDREELLRHRDLIGYGQVNLLNEAKRKVDVFPIRFSDPNYLPTSSLLIASEWPGSRKHALCSVKNLVNQAGLCRYYKYCPYCCFLRQQDLLQTYLPVHSQGFWQFFTLSYTGNVYFTEPGESFQCLQYWNAINHAIRSLLKEQWIAARRSPSLASDVEGVE